MKYRPLENDTWRVHFSTTEYRQMLESSPHREARIAQRLMAHSLRVSTTVSFGANQINKRQTPHGEIYTLFVEAKDSTNRDSATRPRDVWLPAQLVEELKDYRGIDDIEEASSQPLFEITDQTVRNWVSKAAKNAATATGNDNYLKISPHDYRRYFASHMLYRHNVDPEVVRQLGGWQRPEAMFEYLLLPDDVLAEELGSVDLLGAEADKRPAEGTPYREKNAIKTIVEKVEKANHSEVKELAQRISAIFSDVDGVEMAAAGSLKGAERAAETAADSVQSSLQQIENLEKDESGAAKFMSAAKLAYVCALLSGSWVAVGPIL